MNVKNNIKKISAVLASTALVATTLVGAMAYDLSSYPAPFVEDGMAQGAIVVGANAATQDVIGAIDIAASLQAGSVTASAVAGSSSVSVEGAEDFDELLIGATGVSFDARLDDNDLEGFADSDFDFDDTDMDYEDYIWMNTDAILIQGSQDDEDFGNDIYATVDASEIRYLVELDADFNTTLLGEADHDDEIEFKMLGKTVKITDFASATEMTIESSNEYFMNEGDVVSVDGHDITLKRVGSSSVLVTVDGQTLSIASTGTASEKTEDFDQADDFEVRVESAFYIENAEDNSATLRLGSSISDSVQHGESAELFGEPSDEAEAMWVWHIDANNGADAISTIGLQLNIDHEGMDANDADERNSLALGESIDLPNGYASIEYSALKATDFEDLTIKIDDDFNVRAEDQGPQVTDAWGYHFSSDSGDDVFKVSGEDTSEVWVLYSTATEYDIWYEDSGDEVNATTAMNFTMELDSEAFTFIPTANASNDNLTIQFPSVVGYTQETMGIHAVFGQKGFGLDIDEAEATDIYYGATTQGNKKYEDGGYFMTNYGAYFEATDGLTGTDFVLSVPSELQEATIVVKSKGSVVSAGSEGGMSYSVNPIALGLGVLDTDAPALGSKPMIIVGGPAANTVAAEFMGNPTADVIAETFSQGKALIRYDDSNMAMLVAGWGAMETQGAANVVAKYDMYDFEGTELEVVVTDLSNIEVTSMN